VHRRVGEVALIVIALALTLSGLFHDSWFSVASDSGDGRAEIGPRAAKLCQLDECREIPLTQLESSAAVTMGGNIAFFSGLLACLLGALAAALYLAGKAVAGPISPARLSLAFFVASALAALVYLIKQPGGGDLDLSLGAGGPLAVAGCILGAIGGALIAVADRRGPVIPRDRWLDDDLDETSRNEIAPSASSAGTGQATGVGSAVRAPMSPACPRCAAPTEFAEAHQRWFCRSCRAYL
jgi:hypothetical protein